MGLSSPRAKTVSRRQIVAQAVADRVLWQKQPPRYRDAKTGRYLKPTAVRQVIDDEIEAGVKRLRGYGEDLQAGRLTLNQWRDACADEIKLLHLANYAAAKGGFAQLTKDDYATASKIIRRQYRYLERFARELDQNPNKASGDYFLNRLSLYGEAARESYEEARRLIEKGAGMTLERNVLHSRESCKARNGRKGCADLTRLGWVPIGTLPPVGRRACIARCKCTLEFK